ncbi:hypothetical protein TGAMA5MH_09708 [Trichoderma gamsii]|uniref:tyrosinase n=1 Tax=Trichoderma gamsii TaxID=398673 RepID=A0A2K0SYK2_9HYPO|nr:hypothetical protein TGAMA5MH_09708 [Trichoderma gamsii]
MRLFLLLAWALYSIISGVSGKDYDFGVDLVSLTRRQDTNAPIVVSRLPLAANGSIPLRLEIRDVQADKYKWDLYVLALSMFQSVSQDDPLSYYQVAGIHGVPFATWNGVEPVAGASMSGYCPHSSVLFPTWHRPYLALYEVSSLHVPIVDVAAQELHKLADAIARMFSNATERLLYQQAASEFRIPYWDWASPAPAGQSHFPDVFWNSTLTQYGPNGVQVIRNPLYSYSFHPLDEDAFIWPPLLNPTAWMTPQISGETTYTALKGTMQNSSTPLTPFMSSASGTFWDSDMSRTTEVFGYAYGDTSALYGDTKIPRDKLIRKINNWLGKNSPAMIRFKSQSQRRPSGIWKGNSGSKSFQPSSKVDMKDAAAPERHYTEWIANVHVNHGALDGSFTVYFFVGGPPDDILTWGVASNLIGSVGIFTMNGMGSSQSKMSGTAPLTMALMKQVDQRAIRDLEPDSVVPFLQDTLHFRVVDIDNKEVDPALVTGLYVAISSTRVRLPESDSEFPAWGQPTLRLTIWE